jgi:hypothetical protein
MVFYETVQFCFFQGSGNPMIVIINAQHNNFILSFTVMYDSQFFNIACLVYKLCVANF